jgi:hypothetical protein
LQIDLKLSIRTDRSPDRHCRSLLKNGGVRAINISGDLASCSSADKADGRRDLGKMGREVAHGLGDVGSVYVWGVQLVGSNVYASDILNGIWKLSAQ